MGILYEIWVPARWADKHSNEAVLGGFCMKLGWAGKSKMIDFLRLGMGLQITILDS